MLIIFPVFPSVWLQGLYVFAVYFIMHNQLCWPTKASYTVEMNGQDSPDSSYPGGGPTTVGADINKSTQNLISAMEEVPHTHIHNVQEDYFMNCIYTDVNSIEFPRQSFLNPLYHIFLVMTIS